MYLAYLLDWVGGMGGVICYLLAQATLCGVVGIVVAMFTVRTFVPSVVRDWKVDVQMKLTVVSLTLFGCVFGSVVLCGSGDAFLVVVFNSGHQLMDVDTMSIDRDVHDVEVVKVEDSILTTAICRSLL